MRKLLFISLMALLAIVALRSPATQAIQAPAGGRGQAPASKPVGVDLATAKKMVAAAEAAALSANAPVAVAVVDGNGDLVFCERMDGASPRAVTSSQGKARAALLFGVPTKDIQDAVAAGKPLSAMITNPPAGAFELTPMQGGLPILKDGKVVGAIGAGGSAPANDEKFAQAGLSAFTPMK